MPNLVLYHANCKDGFAAALAAWHAFGEAAVYESIQYQSYEWVDRAEGLYINTGSDHHIWVADGDEVYILDFSLKFNEIFVLARHASKIVLLDHHKTAEQDLKNHVFPNNVHIKFDMAKSGCELAWEFFAVEPMPYWIRLIGLRDLWKHKGTEMEQTAEEINLALETVPFDFKIWMELTMRELVTKGKALREYFNMLVTQVAEHARVLEDIAIVNAPYFMASELGNLLAQKHKYACIYSIAKNKEVLCSFRSVGNYDVSEVAKQFGGGGHRNAAGCKFPDYAAFQQVFG